MTPQRQQTFTMTPQGPYDFPASIRFLEGFTPAAYTPRGEAVLRMAFPVDGSFVPSAVAVRQIGENVQVEAAGNADAEVVCAQVARILSLDHDGTGYPEVIAGDPVLTRLTSKTGLLRPVLFNSPYEAAAWAIIGNRIRITQAAGIKAAMAEQFGSTLGIDGQVCHAFPAPEVLSGLESFRGLFGRKVEYLRALGESTLAGHLNVDRLREMTPDAAIEHLKELKGIGNFGAELILLRGVGVVDRIPTNEGRFPRAVAMAYGIEQIPPDDLQAITATWAPFRTWVSVLMRANLEARTHEIGGKPA